MHAADAVFCRCCGRQGNDGGRLAAQQGMNFRRRLQAIHARHVDVHENQSKVQSGGLRPSRRLHRLLAIQSCLRLVAKPAQHGTRDLQVDGVVIHDQRSAVFRSGDIQGWLGIGRYLRARLYRHTACHGVEQLQHHRDAQDRHERRAVFRQAGTSDLFGQQQQRRRWLRSCRRQRRQSLLEPGLQVGIRRIEVAHGRFDVLPADVFHQFLDVPAAGAGPAGKAAAHGVAAIFPGSHDANLRKQAAQQSNQAVGMQGVLGDMSPAVDLAEHRTLGQADPSIEGGHGAQTGQSRAFEDPALLLPVAFAAAQVAGQALAGLDLDVFDAQVDQLIRAKATLEPQQ